MTRKDEAVKAIEGMGDGRNVATDGGLLPLIHATLALVEAQEAANEQLRIANLIALGLLTVERKLETGEIRIKLETLNLKGTSAVDDIAEALGIYQEDEQ